MGFSINNRKSTIENHLSQDAFTYITALVFVTVIGISLTTGSAYWSTIIAREKEKELLFRGNEIRRAIESYYNGAPGGGSHQYPASLNDLLKDNRYLATRRYLRKIYKDPLTKDGQWGLITAPGGKVKGVFSTSKAMPLKAGNFSEDLKAFENAEKYSEWRFVYPLEVEADTAKASGSKGAKGDKTLQEDKSSVQEEVAPEEEESSQEEVEQGDEETDDEEVVPEDEKSGLE
jgi:type II secretory pathway pseudopilin PulG